jgi:hypothetical protein
MDQTASSRKAESAKARFIRKKILQHKRRFRNKKYQQLKINASPTTYSHQTGMFPQNRNITTPKTPIINGGPILNSHKSPASVTVNNQSFTTPPPVSHPMSSVQHSTDASHEFTVLAADGKCGRPRKPRTKQTPDHALSPISTPLYVSQYNLNQSDKENNQSHGPSSRRESISSAKYTPLTNITSNYVNRQKNTIPFQPSGGSQPKPKQATHLKSTKQSMSFQVNLATKFNATKSTPVDIPVREPNQLPTTFASGLKHKRTHPNITPSQDAIPSSSGSDSSEDNQSGYESESESDCDDPHGSLTNALLESPLGFCCCFPYIYILPRITLGTIILIVIYPLNVYAGYSDIGDPLFECQACGALMWYQERRQRSRHSSNPTFQICCGNGKVQLPLLKHPPPVLKHLLIDSKTKESQQFQQSVRMYNAMFSFTSPGMKFDKKVTGGKGPPTLRLHGQPCHRMGSLLPNTGEAPRFAQLYIYDTDNEINNRIQSCGLVTYFCQFYFSLIRLHTNPYSLTHK